MSRSGSIRPVRSPRTNKVIGFQRYVPYVTKDGRKTKRMQFLARSKWPRSKSTLKRLGVRESLSQIEKNNLANLRRGRKMRGRKSKSRSRSSSRKSSRKSARRSRSRQGRMSAHESAFRKHYSRPDAATTKAAKKAVTTKNLRKSMMYGTGTKAPVKTKAAKPSQKKRKAVSRKPLKRNAFILTQDQIDQLFPYFPESWSGTDIREHVALNYTTDDTFNYIKSMLKRAKGSSVGASKPRRPITTEIDSFVDYMQEFYGDRAGATYRGTLPKLTKKEVVEAVKYLKSPKAKDEFMSWGGGDSMDRENARDLILKARGKKPWGTKAPVGASVTRSSSSMGAAVSRKWKKSHPRDKSGRFVSPTKRRKQSKSKKSRKSRSKSSRRDSRAWSKKKNQALRRLMKREFGHILTKAEYKALPKSVQRELQLQAYEAAYPEKVKSSPDRLLSNKALAKRVSAKDKKAKKEALKAAKKSRSKSRKSVKSRARRAPMHPEGKYPGEAQAIQDFISAYAGKKYKTEAARLAAMTKDLKKTNKVVKRSTSYDAWKKEPWEYDLGGIDTEGSDDSFMRQLRSGGFMSGMSKAGRKKYY